MEDSLMTEKNIWVQPEAVVQGFVANEYVAACWGVSCDFVGTDAVGGLHRSQFCGQPDHYAISLDDNGVPTSMTETQTDTLGDLPCTLYTDESYTTTRDVASVQNGDYIYWTTQHGASKWLHKGAVSGTSNHS